MNRFRILGLGAALLLSPPLFAIENAYPEGGIQDNSFLIEEAYNQDAGVVQHIQTFSRDFRNHSWIYTFTQEWPVPKITHQLSYTIPIENLEPHRSGTKLGDIALNYRYQLAGSGETGFACSPRFSILLPTGDSKRGYGTGSTGLQALVPVSVVLSPKLVSHSDLGFTYTPSARDAAGEKADTRAYFLGQSLVWLARPTLNLFLEAAWNGAEEVTGANRTRRQNSFFLNPGVRWAYNFKSGLQVVPGLSVPIGVGPSAGQRSIFLYLSFEHPMWKAAN